MDTTPNTESTMKVENMENAAPSKQKKTTKKPTGKPGETRARAKSTLVNVFSGGGKTQPGPVKNEVKVEQSDRFKNLLSMFDKKEPAKVESKEDPSRKQLDMSKFGLFQGSKENEAENAANIQRGSAVISGGIQERLAKLMSQNKKEEVKPSPLEELKKRQQAQLDEDEEEDFEDDFNDHISDEEDKNDDLSESLSISDKQEKEENKKNDKSDNDDSFDDEDDDGGDKEEKIKEETKEQILDNKPTHKDSLDKNKNSDDIIDGNIHQSQLKEEF
jgi:hypothetical protein